MSSDLWSIYSHWSEIITGWWISRVRKVALDRRAGTGQQVRRHRGARLQGCAAGPDEPAVVVVAERLPVVVPLRIVGLVVVGDADDVEKTVAVEVGGAHAAGVGRRLG